MTRVLATPDPAALVAGLVFAVLVVDPEHRIVQGNPEAEDLFGRSEARMCGMSIGEVARFEEPRIAALLLDAEAQFVARDLTMIVDDRQRRVNLTCSPVPSHPGWRVLTFSEIGQSERDEDDGERVELRAPAVLAHEIKNPLSAIRGASQLLERRASDRDLPLAKLIVSEVDRIAELVDRMQQLGSRLATPSNRPCNLHQAIRNAISTVSAARDGSVSIEEAFDPSLPSVAADGSILEQVLINLVANACDAASDCDGPGVTVRTRFASGLVFNAIRLGKSTRLPIEIIVSDNGPGVDPSLRDHIFEPFVTGKSGGQGLGLALVRKLVRDMGGRVTHERDERAGLTHFRINLPVAEGAGA